MPRCTYFSLINEFLWKFIIRSSIIKNGRFKNCSILIAYLIIYMFVTKFIAICFVAAKQKMRILVNIYNILRYKTMKENERRNKWDVIERYKRGHIIQYEHDLANSCGTTYNDRIKIINIMDCVELPDGETGVLDSHITMICNLSLTALPNCDIFIDKLREYIVDTKRCTEC